MSATIADTLNVPCPTCGVLAGRYCTGDEGGGDAPGTWAHKSRWQAAEKPAPIDLARGLPPLALAEMRRVLVHGAAKHGAAGPGETGGGQGAADHVSHAADHITEASLFGSEPWGRDGRDAETGALHLIHAACRLMLAAELVLRDQARAKGEG